ncbi:dead end protein 1 [Amphiprion ocellaris]|uniref:RRM domain-containing protein n=1 Tax=Amphiprion ocellaris TaxID=80972 RepID=A0A3Q1AXK1_AMPOC|nr:dead end protein 1 [Amphiprion ocellaris]
MLKEPPQGGLECGPIEGRRAAEGRHCEDGEEAEKMMEIEQMLNVERVRALEAWLETTNTKVVQVNGQRKYGGPPEVWDGPAPGSRCEVYISEIPRDAYEDLLIPLFSSVGPLWEFRLMMNFSGQNRGFAYAKYGTSAVATDAIRLLNGYMLEPGLRLSVRRSVEKRHLCIGDLPAATRQDDLLQVLRVFAEGVEKLSLKTGPGIDGVSAIVTFSSHHTASMAKKVVVEAFKKHFALTVSIKWQTTEKLNPNEPQHLQKPPKSLPLPPKPPRHAHNSPRHAHNSPRHAHSSRHSVLPPRLAVPPSVPPGFCRAVGGPRVPQQLHPSCSSSFCSQGHLLFAGSPVMLLQKLCEAVGVGEPCYEMQYSHAGPDGFLYFTYKVRIPGITAIFKGLVTILPGPNAGTMEEEARRAAAQQVLQRVYNHQLTS